jgi:ABC-type uncharacterized transport system ATPase subunit
LLALILPVLAAILLFRTPLGFALRAVGFNPEAARHAGINVNRQYVLAISLSGAAVANLSGGNQQKVVLGRELDSRPRVLVAAQPTRGLDVGATGYVHKALLAQRDAGAAILLISTELEEVLALSDRIIVLYEGRIVGEVPGDRANAQQIGLMMAGVQATQPAVHQNANTNEA